MSAPRDSGHHSTKVPDKGAFPLDHFHECDKEAKIYNDCVIKHQLMPKRCRKFQVDYLQCRMKSGLMEKEDMEKLGFTEEVSWETEEAEKKYLFDKIQRLKERAKENIRLQEEYKRKMTAKESSQKDNN